MGAVFDGMPDVDREFEVDPWGRIRVGGKCRDDYGRLKVYDQPPKGGAPIILQHAALESFKRCENIYGGKRWRPGFPKVIKADGRPKFRPIFLTGSLRACATQAKLFASDNKRFAHPDTTGHTRGLCIDVHTGYLNATIRDILLKHDWHQSRPDDEPWHFSFGIKV